MTIHHPTILVVDDEPPIRDVLVAVLQDQGHAVVTANDGQAAPEMVQHVPPALILMDVMMPRLDGRAAFRALRDRGSGDHVPVILMSAMARPADLDAEVAAFLRKPIDLQELLALVARVLASR